MNTSHNILIADSRDIPSLPSSSIDLVVTSPPYPMIEMWDSLFSGWSRSTAAQIGSGDGDAAFESMHRELDKAWAEVHRVLKIGGIACVNVGDATRSIGGRFRLFSNHSRIITAFGRLGFDSLPVILWRKTTNAPNKFMGSGMLPAGAYVTLEHEYILIFRKAGRREFATKADKSVRSASAFFWEERNRWFSDVWEFPGARQAMAGAALRDRTAAFPVELAGRLICMYSVYGDTVLDPFAGTGTTLQAAIALGRNSIGVEIDGSLLPLVRERIAGSLPLAQALADGRIRDHLAFVRAREEAGKPPKYRNEPHGFPVVTRQETGMCLYRASRIVPPDNRGFSVEYEDPEIVNGPVVSGN